MLFCILLFRSAPRLRAHSSSGYSCSQLAVSWGFRHCGWAELAAPRLILAIITSFIAAGFTVDLACSLLVVLRKHASASQPAPQSLLSKSTGTVIVVQARAMATDSRIYCAQVFEPVLPCADGFVVHSVLAIQMTECASSSFTSAGSGTIDVKELKLALAAMGQNPSDEELHVMIKTVDEDGSGEIEFGEFCAVSSQQILWLLQAELLLIVCSAMNRLSKRCAPAKETR